jgi:hypothetical protein
MLTDQSDPNNILGLIGKLLAYHNLITLLCNYKFNGRKNAPFQDRLKIEKKYRDYLCHEVWEVIHSNIHAVNNGPPKWSITYDQMQKIIIQIKETHSLIVNSEATNPNYPDKYYK